MKLEIKTIPHCTQRYETAGDYWIDSKGVFQVRISEMKKQYEWLVLLHELMEICLCLFQGVKFKYIDKFDIQYEKDRRRGLHSKDSEPGDDKSAPYCQQHCFATALERMACAALGEKWSEYEDACNRLIYTKKWEKRVCAVE